MRAGSQIDDSNKMKLLLKAGQVFSTLALAVMLAIILFASVLVPPLLKSDQPEMDYTDSNQELVGHDLRPLVENIKVFEQQLRGIPRDEIAPEPLFVLLYGEQPTSLDSIFMQIEEIEQIVAEDSTRHESPSTKAAEKPSIFPVLAILLLSFSSSILCLGLLVVLRLIGMKSPSFSGETGLHPETEQGKETKKSTPSLIPSSKVPGPLAIFIGKDAAENVLGAMYQAVYAHENQLADVEVGYMVNIAGQFLDRFQSQYDLQPLGQPSEGPVEYDPQQHVCWEFARKGEPVWVVQPGWIHGSKVYAKALVSKKKRPIIS